MLKAASLSIIRKIVLCLVYFDVVNSDFEAAYSLCLQANGISCIVKMKGGGHHSSLIPPPLVPSLLPDPTVALFMLKKRPQSATEAVPACQVQRVHQQDSTQSYLGSFPAGDVESRVGLILQAESVLQLMGSVRAQILQ